MRLLTDDIARLSEGTPALADPTPELAGVPARLTVTAGVGMGLLEAAGRADVAPDWLAAGLPAFGVDRLEEQWSGGDLVLQVAADDPLTVSHAVRVLLTDADPFATVRWVQSGFHRPAGTAPVGITGRNLFGQVDGTENPQPGSDDFAQVVWVGSQAPAWLVGGTAMVVRRIAMDLRVWGGLDVMTKEASVGRRLADGAPLTGGTETTAPDFQAVDDDGFPVIPETAHIRLAHATAPGERILRRPYNYDDGLRADGSADAGLVFVAFMADPQRQFVPIQQRLADADVLNLWTTPIGSALFAVLPGVAPGEVLGQALLG
jgi:dye decolorizing peroxidase